ncbi:DUF2004 domain-containing protein [Kitasatospora sp. NPDC056327]|uniref:DUF2004 domain-containing protein n=1 Tax=Kitasatospora sp. NPDC056327 TaxID=3345785 RepID=UPI0035D731AF
MSRMKTVEHDRFGRLEAGAAGDADTLWQGTAPLGAEEVDVLLWASGAGAPDSGELDDLAARLAALPALDAAARAALRAYLGGDRHFIDFHVEELADSAAVGRLVREAAGADVPVDAFVAALRLHGVGLWPGGPSRPPAVVLDYVFEPGLSDQVLAVRATRHGAVVSVDWES